jgi:heme exporter protein C
MSDGATMYTRILSGTGRWLHQQLSLKHFFVTAGFCWPWIIGFSLLFMGYGLIGGLFLSPPDYQQGEAFRIIYVHVPSSFMSLFIYTIIGIQSLVFLIWRIKVCDLIAHASASIGAIFTLIALLTGALWGKPMWGTWWVWDARLTSELILLFLYAGYKGLREAIPNRDKAALFSAILALMGLIDIPIIHFSVEWFNTLHQGATLSKFAKPSIAPSMLYPLLAMCVGFCLFYCCIVFLRVRTLIIERTMDV